MPFPIAATVIIASAGTASAAVLPFVLPFLVIGVIVVIGLLVFLNKKE